MDPVITGRNQEGQFAAGSSGNPRGKPTGARGKATQLLDRMAEKGAAAVLKTVLAAAKDGDTAAATLLLSRVWPPRKGRPIQFPLPDLLQPGGAPAALAAIARLTSDGVISVEEAGEIAKVAETYMRATDTMELLRRIERLEEAIAAAIQPGPASATTRTAVRRNGSAAA